MKIRLRLHIDERRQSQLSRAIQVVSVDLVFISLDRGNFDVVVDALVDLGVTYLPAIPECDYRIPMDARLTLWISPAVFLHVPETVGLPSSETSFYAGVWWWGHLMHTSSSSVIAAAGYATVHAVDEHATDIYLPPRLMFVFILLFALAFGVFWGVTEFAIFGVASLVGTASVLTRYDLDDTLLDLVFNTVGGVIVAAWGTAHLLDAVGTSQRRLKTTPC